MELVTHSTIFDCLAEFGCAYSEEEIPVPIPNTEVKLLSGDGTAALAVGEQHGAAY